MIKVIDHPYLPLQMITEKGVLIGTVARTMDHEDMMRSHAAWEILRPRRVFHARSMQGAIAAFIDSRY